MCVCVCVCVYEYVWSVATGQHTIYGNMVYEYNI